MNTLSQPPTPDLNIIISPFLEAIDNRRLKIRLRRDHAPLVTAYGLLHRRMNRAITLALDAVEKYETARREEGFGDTIKGQPSFATDAFTDAVYRAAELFEFYDSDIVDYLDPSLSIDIKRQYKKALKGISEHWERLCNGCKHNHSFLIPVEGNYADGAWLCGYSSYRHNGEEMRIDRGIHQFSDVLSYNWAFRRLMGAILEADTLATMLVNTLPDDPSADVIDSNLLPLPYAHSFPRITARSLDAFPGEDRHYVPDLAFAGDNGENIRLAATPPIKRTAECILRCVIEITTASMAIQQPYSDEMATFALTRGEGSERLPLGGFYRILLGNVRVQPITTDP